MNDVVISQYGYMIERRLFEMKTMIFSQKQRHISNHISQMRIMRILILILKVTLRIFLKKIELQNLNPKSIRRKNDFFLLTSLQKDIGKRINIIIQMSSRIIWITAGEILIWKQYNNSSVNSQAESFILNNFPPPMNQIAFNTENQSINFLDHRYPHPE